MIDMDTFELINKVYVPKKKKSKTRVLMKIAVFLCLIFIVISLIVGKGFNGSIAPVALLLVVNLSGLASNKSYGEYKNVPCSIVFGDDHLKIINHQLDRDDSLGLREETTEIRYSEIINIEYSRELNGIRLTGNALKNIQWFTKHNEKRSRNEKERFVYIYLSDTNRESIIKTLSEKTGITVAEVK